MTTTKYYLKVIYEEQDVVYTDANESYYEVKNMFDLLYVNAGAKLYMMELVYRNGRYEMTNILFIKDSMGNVKVIEHVEGE